MLVQRINGYLVLIGWSPWNIKGLAKELYIIIYNYEILVHQSLVPKVVPGHCIVKTGHWQCLKTGTC